MLDGKTIAVVVPAYNEESQIGMVIETMPDFVDRIIIVNDMSSDKTADIVKKYIGKKKSKVVIKKAKDIKPNKYNEADIVVQEKNKEELKHFIPSEIVNNNPEKDRIILINHLKNGGVGAAIARGYKWCKDHEIDFTAVMAGDGQMDPSELKSLCLPAIHENIDYVNETKQE